MATFLIGGETISDTKPLPIKEYGGTVSVPLNDGSITMSSSASTEIIGAAAAGISERVIWIVNETGVKLHLGFGEAATTAMFGLPAGATYKTTYLGAVNGRLASGSDAAISAIAEGR
ncbi:MAG: hypothetical protein IT337_09325 [Thermomicrobiales bacterium]|nr:hypothetical protein [Thermomicrobiales bacterium]